ncbi:hypothetical protein [Candidatus Uabimicrobium sp. HlEnr_7]|uniref:hypothetical protein n=1 Tax=Candidatus Uabimicrobium helgolandensis TaxID=3095367 RepID=UPI0035582D5A
MSFNTFFANSTLFLLLVLTSLGFAENVVKNYDVTKIIKESKYPEETKWKVVRLRNLLTHISGVEKIEIVNSSPKIEIAVHCEEASVPHVEEFFKEFVSLSTKTYVISALLAESSSTNSKVSVIPFSPSQNIEVSGKYAHFQRVKYHFGQQASVQVGDTITYLKSYQVTKEDEKETATPQMATTVKNAVIFDSLVFRNMRNKINHISFSIKWLKLMSLQDKKVFLSPQLGEVVIQEPQREEKTLNYNLPLIEKCVKIETPTFEFDGKSYHVVIKVQEF